MYIYLATWLLTWSSAGPCRSRTTLLASSGVYHGILITQGLLSTIGFSPLSRQVGIVLSLRHFPYISLMYLRYTVAVSYQILIDKFQKKYPTLEILTWNSDEDHIHIQVIIPPNIPVSEFVQIFKSRTSLHLKRRFKFIAKIYTKSDSIWSVGYFSSTLWLNDETVRRYIEQQGSEDIPTEQSYLDL